MQDKKNQQTSHKKAHKTIPTTTNQQTGSVPSRPSGPHRFVAYTNRAPRAARKIVHRLVQEGGFPSSTDPSTDDKMGERLLCFFSSFASQQPAGPNTSRNHPGWAKMAKQYVFLIYWPPKSELWPASVFSKAQVPGPVFHAPVGSRGFCFLLSLPLFTLQHVLPKTLIASKGVNVSVLFCRCPFCFAVGVAKRLA